MRETHESRVVGGTRMGSRKGHGRMCGVRGRGRKAGWNLAVVVWCVRCCVEAVGVGGDWGVDVGGRRGARRRGEIERKNQKPTLRRRRISRTRMPDADRPGDPAIARDSDCADSVSARGPCGWSHKTMAQRTRRFVSRTEFYGTRASVKMSASKAHAFRAQRRSGTPVAAPGHAGAAPWRHATNMCRERVARPPRCHPTCPPVLPRTYLSACSAAYSWPPTCPPVLPHSPTCPPALPRT